MSMIRIKIKKPRKHLRSHGPAPCRVRAGHSAEALGRTAKEGALPKDRLVGTGTPRTSFPFQRGGKFPPEVERKKEGAGGRRGGPPPERRLPAAPPPPSRPPCQPACLPASLPQLLTCRRLSRRQLPLGTPRPGPKVAALRSFSLRLLPPQEPLDPPPLLFREETATMLLSPPQTPTGGSRARPERRRWRDREGDAERARSLCCGQGAPAGGVRREPWG